MDLFSFMYWLGFEHQTYVLQNSALTLLYSESRSKGVNNIQ